MYGLCGSQRHSGDIYFQLLYFGNQGSCAEKNIRGDDLLDFGYNRYKLFYGVGNKARVRSQDLVMNIFTNGRMK